MCETKICSDCKLEKLHAEFTIDKRSPAGITGRCKSCTKIKAQAWYKKNKERVLRNRILAYEPKGKATFPHLTEEAKNIGAELIGEHPKMGYGTYRLQCGHVSAYKFEHVRNNNVLCHTCFDEELAFQAMSVGITLNFGVDRSKAGYRNYTLPCGHVRDIRIVHVNAGNFKCKICQELRNKKSAENAGITLIGASSNSDPNYRNYLLPCGCVRDISIKSVLNGSWLCRECNYSSFNRKSSLYLLKFKTDNFSWLKFGFSQCVEGRIKEYQLPEPFSSETILIKEIDTGQAAMLIEKEVHKRLKQLRLPKETMKKFHTKSGFTECYKDGVENIIVLEIKKVLQEYGKKEDKQITELTGPA